MAIARDIENCPNCGKPLKARHKNMGNDFVGDTFLGYEPCDCKNRKIDTPLQPVKDEKVIISREKIAEIMRDNISFSGQTGSYMIYGAIDKIIELFKEWHNKLSEPSSKEQEAVGFAEWIMENYWIPDKENKTWMKMIKGKWEDLTTEQLYQLYKNKNL